MASAASLIGTTDQIMHSFGVHRLGVQSEGVSRGSRGASVVLDNEG
jgi:hypothetical protein